MPTLEFAMHTCRTEARAVKQRRRKTANGEFGPFRRFRTEKAVLAAERRHSIPPYLALQSNFALNNGERKFVENKCSTNRNRTRDLPVNIDCVATEIPGVVPGAVEVLGRVASLP